MKHLKKWPRLYRDSTPINGRIFLGRVKASGVSTRAIWSNCAGSESDDHIKEIKSMWPWLTDAEIIQAIRFERSRGIAAGTENY